MSVFSAESVCLISKHVFRMFCRMDGFFFKPKRCTFSVLVLQNIVMLLLLTESYRGESQGVGPSQTITALVGEDVILPCQLEPAVDAVSKIVEWGRPDLEPRFVHVRHEGQNLLDNQNPSYKGRTSVSVDKLRHGDLSLKLSAVRLSDNGVYRCYFPSQKKQSTVELVVGSFSPPAITGLDRSTSGVVLQCESLGWYPEPEVLWLDSEGNLLSAGSTESVRGSDGLYTVSSRVTVERRHNNMFTCRVTQNNINQTRETHIHVPADMFLTSSSAAARFGIIVFILLSLVVADVFVFWRWSQNQRKDEAERHQSESAEREQLSGKKTMEDLEEKKETLEEELKRKEEEQTDLELMIHKLKEQNKKLHNQMVKVRDVEEESTNISEDIEEKMKSAEKIAESDKEQGYLEMTRVATTTKKHLNLRKQVHQNLYNEAERLEILADSLLQTTSDRKKSSEEQKKKVKDQLEDIRRKLSET
ncbi:butyrophilin subfamily 3 member A2-like [Labrus mixtus]|uniref:butyrophilin subfamily 3 member A2-like n=1 Tax=Labrus mixtus TaxID=508554 RepID=UPI0029C0B889|nr:butyrophilin subfamily 3 member A2-like [Labrus mixtus]